MTFKNVKVTTKKGEPFLVRIRKVEGPGDKVSRRENPYFQTAQSLAIRRASLGAEAEGVDAAWRGVGRRHRSSVDSGKSLAVDSSGRDRVAIALRWISSIRTAHDFGDSWQRHPRHRS